MAKLMGLKKITLSPPKKILDPILLTKERNQYLAQKPMEITLK